MRRRRKKSKQHRKEKMKYLSKVLLIIVCGGITLMSLKSLKFDHAEQNGDIIKICCVVCGAERIEESVTLIKSTLIHKTKQHIEFIILTEVELFSTFSEVLNKLKSKKKFSFNLRQIEFPRDENSEESWKKLFKPCAAQRLFLPSLLTTENRVIYVDTDVLFLASPTEIYDKFHDFHTQQHSGLVQESESKNLGN